MMMRTACVVSKVCSKISFLDSAPSGGKDKLQLSHTYCRESATTKLHNVQEILYLTNEDKRRNPHIERFKILMI
jgi:hypothetical protein